MFTQIHTHKSTSMEVTRLHTRKLLPQTWLNRLFAFIYTIAILFLFYHHFLNLIHSPYTLISISLILSDLILSFMWIASQAFRINPTIRQVFPENLPQVAKESEYPALDVFICTADPYKEPPIGVVNTALSVLAYDYPVDKLSVYVSDDGGSQLTLFAFMEAAKFAKHWLPYCKKNNIVDRCPEVYFGCNHGNWLPEAKEIELMYKSMKAKVEKVMEKGSVCNLECISDTDNDHDGAFSKWTHNFTPRDHPTIIEVLLESSKDKDINDSAMPNLIYVSREKRNAKPHHFKAGALNTLLRVSTVMTNAPIFLTIDCDMYSNDPKTPLGALCYFVDPNMDPKLAFVQFPQRFNGINKNDIYGSEFKVEAQIDILGFDGLLGPYFAGTGAFFRRLALFGPSDTSLLKPESKSIRSKDVMALAHHVAGSNYEDNTKWGFERGFRYGSLVEDINTSYRLHCEGWKSIFCNPKRPAFLGNSLVALHDVLNQTKRWYMGFLEIAFTKHSPLTFGIMSMNLLQALCYVQYTFRPFWSIPVLIYALVSDPWFFLYAFLFTGAYGKNLLDFLIAGGSIQRWWSNQRMWLIWGVSSFPIALLEYSLKSLNIRTFGFNVTSKVIDNEQENRYKKGMFEFGIDSPMFFLIATAATINLFAFVQGIIGTLKGEGEIEEMFVQMFITSFVVVNSLPVYEAMVFRSDEGKMPLKITLKSIALSLFLYLSSSLAF